MLAFVVGIAIGSASIYLYLKNSYTKMAMNDMQTAQIATRENVAVDASRGRDVQTKDGVGVITSFSGNMMVVKMNPLDFPPAESESSRKMIVMINEKTKFVLMTPKVVDVLRKEMDDFQNITVAERGAAMAPPVFITKELSRDAFITGQRVMVTSFDAITPTTTSITAETISLLEDIPQPPIQ